MNNRIGPLRSPEFAFKNPIVKNRQRVTPVMASSDYNKGYKDEYNKESLPPGSAVESTPIVTSSSDLTSSNIQHIKISVRLPRGIVTSLTLKKNIIALWMLYRTPSEFDPEQVIDLLEEGVKIKDDTIKEMVTSFVYKCLGKWDSDTGKGLSDFVTELMIEDALEKEDHFIYQMIMGNIIV